MFKNLSSGYEFVKVKGDRNIHIRKAGDVIDIAYRIFKSIDLETVPAEAVEEEDICSSCLDTARMRGGVLIVV